MTAFDPDSVEKLEFTEEQVAGYLESAKKFLCIADESKTPEVKFQFSYDALLKLGITALAHKGYRVKIRLGHHMKTISALAEILNDKNIAIMGNSMRSKRNLDLYDQGWIVTEKEADEYCSFTKQVSKKVKALMKPTA
ncbi:MAG: hypothetical protein WC846_01130 [Candidatus Gracilibacteria bacterium]|jgi:hypothetical protein